MMLVTDAVGQGKVPKEHDAKGLAARLLARRTRKMSTDYSPLKKVSAFSLFDGCLDEFGVREHIKPDETTETIKTPDH